MKKNYLWNTLVLFLAIIVPLNLFGEEPKQKKELSNTPVTAINMDMFNQGNSITDVGYLLKWDAYSQRSSGQKYGGGNSQDVYIRSTNMVRDNIGITAGLEYDRTAWKPNSGMDNITKYRGITLGVLYGDQTQSGIGYYAGLDINAGYNTDKYYSYNDGGYDPRKNSNPAAGFEINTGILMQNFSNNSILTKINAGYDRFTNYYDTYNNIDSRVCIDINTVAEVGCEDFYCKMDDYDFPSRIDNHQQGNFYFDSYNPIWVSFGSEKNKYDNGTINSWGNFSGGFDLSLNYYVIDNIKVKGGAYLDLYGDHSKDDESKYKSNDFGVYLGGGINAPTTDWLNNFSANGEVEVGKSNSESTDYMGNVSYTNSDLKLQISGYVRWEVPLTEKVSGYIDAGLKRTSYSDTNSDYSYNRFGPFAEFGLYANFNTIRSF
ncbi:hypothetical protein ACE01N_06960 [Saccharicrinis sp. FJH2]|uniref:hypothetical protein n=1 Tax=Saccharicrinis sp. FJH65 TaxID=3344659 RepID=UPI0035F2C731